MDTRYERLKKILDGAGADAVIIASQEDQRYLEGFVGGDCLLVASGEKNWLIADTRYEEMARHQCRTAEVALHKRGETSIGDVAAACALKSGFRQVAFETDIPWSLWSELAVSFKASGTPLVPLEASLDEMRAVKDRDEIEKTKEACRIADAALEQLLPSFRPGVSELEMKTELEYAMKRLGADDVSFDTMVLFGARSSQPHAVSERGAILREGDFILIDYGAAFEGYRSDTTRTFFYGRASDRQREAYASVIRALDLSLEMMRPGAVGGEICRAAAKVIEDAGFPPFGHALGHGVGLKIHEWPSMRAISEAVLEPGMIVTAEPGTYTPGWGGIRVEDTVVITENGVEILTRFTKELKEL